MLKKSKTTYWPINANVKLYKLTAFLLAKKSIKIKKVEDRNLEYASVVELIPGKKKLLLILINNLENLVYHIIKYNLNSLEMQKIIVYSIFTILTQQLLTLTKSKLPRFPTNMIYVNYQIYNQLENLIFEKLILYEILLQYLILGAKPSLYTHKILLYPEFLLLDIEVLLEDWIIHLNNCFLSIFVLNLNPNIGNMLYKQWEKHDTSSRQVAQSKNNIAWKTYLTFYLFEPKAIFENKYIIYHLNKIQIQRKELYFLRNMEVSYLLPSQLAITFILEVQDFIIPKVGKFSMIIINIVKNFIIKLLLKNKTIQFFNKSY
uniref:hypothetical protein n=1 Tax=Glaucosphaera vacuolata TaxID=38265 RepID=UPI001FCE13E1|nr:hypothetical protein MW444_pgp051 [Glaucosphaera vacuolata]UNJ18709.1 hypothetical protein [Glaucosphaera vacuolata]